MHGAQWYEKFVEQLPRFLGHEVVKDHSLNRCKHHGLNPGANELVFFDPHGVIMIDIVGRKMCDWWSIMELKGIEKMDFQHTKSILFIGMWKSDLMLHEVGSLVVLGSSGRSDESESSIG